MINKKLKEIRKEQNISQQELSEKIFVNQNTISQYESGKRTINSEMLEKIADTLGYNISFLKKEERLCTLERMKHNELINKMNLSILNQTGIDMDFEFELCSDGNLDLYVKHIFSIEDLEKLIKIKWFDESILEYYNFGYDTNPFELDDELSLPNNLFSFILEKTFKPGAFVSGVFELDEYIELNISIPR